MESRSSIHCSQHLSPAEIATPCLPMLDTLRMRPLAVSDYDPQPHILYSPEPWHATEADESDRSDGNFIM